MVYIVVGGYVTSWSDGDRHYINAPTLCRLYGLNPNSTAVLLLEAGDPCRKRELLAGIKGGKFLYPRPDGKYRLLKPRLNGGDHKPFPTKGKGEEGNELSKI